MAQRRRFRIHRRYFLQRSPLFLGALAFAACRRPVKQGSELTGAANAQSVAKSTVAKSTAQASPVRSVPALTPACGDSPVTPAQTPGPFFKSNSPQRQSLLDANMLGRRLTITGRVLDSDCQPVANCLLDFWQTDAEGNYDNQGDRLRGHQFTDDEGCYRLDTIVPGIYPGRTRHLHVRVQPARGPVLTTQLYLPEESRNLNDFLFQPELLMTMQRTAADEQAQFDFVVETARS